MLTLCAIASLWARGGGGGLSYISAIVYWCCISLVYFCAIFCVCHKVAAISAKASHLCAHSSATLWHSAKKVAQPPRTVVRFYPKACCSAMSFARNPKRGAGVAHCCALSPERLPCRGVALLATAR